MDTKKNFRDRTKEKLIKDSKKYHSKKLFLNKQIEALLKHLKAKNILLYCPMPLEVDIFPLLFSLKKQRYNIFIPKIIGVSFDVVKFSLPLEKNKYKILESRASIKSPKLDVLVVPILGMDKSFRRIGFGKGMYDRFVAKQKKKPKIIFVIKNLYFSKEIITQDYDVKGDYLFCNQAILKRGKNDRIFSYRFLDGRYCGRCIHLPLY